MTDEEILKLWGGGSTGSRPVIGKNKVITFARALLSQAAPVAHADAKPLTDGALTTGAVEVSFDDPRVQLVYGILCGPDDPPMGEHWEGWVSRRIVNALSSRHGRVPANVIHCS